MNVTTVRVTTRHIDQGIPGNACNCAFALAVIDALDNEGIIINSVWVGSAGPGDMLRADVQVTDGEAYTALVGADTERWISEFDAGMTVQPIEVTLDWETTS